MTLLQLHVIKLKQLRFSKFDKGVRIRPIAISYFLVFMPLAFCSKDQIISKRFFLGRGFFKKTNENTSHTSKNEFIRSFFEEPSA